MDWLYVCMFMLIFACALCLYGWYIHKSGKVESLPYRIQHTIQTASDVRRIGYVTTVVGLCMGVLVLIAIVIMAILG